MYALTDRVLLTEAVHVVSLCLLCDDYSYDSTWIRRPFDCLSEVITVTVT